MIKYHKLVRDKIPEIIETSGKSSITKILSDEEFKVELKKKAQEELKEYLEATTDLESIEELADLLEIIHSLASTHGTTIEEIEKVRDKKAVERGGFNNKIFLIGVINGKD